MSWTTAPSTAWRSRRGTCARDSNSTCWAITCGQTPRRWYSPGTYFEGAEADAWRTKGLALLRRELQEQVLPDGGHFERSPMYHAIVLEDLLDLLQLARVYPGLFAEDDVTAWRETVQRMHRWLRVMTHPDGGIAFFNDAALDIAPTLAALTEYASALGVACDQAPLADIEALADSGYVRLQTGPAVLIADVGEIGPDYLPGHAHADTLSFELSLQGRRVLVNRARQRTKMAQNGCGSEGRRPITPSSWTALILPRSGAASVWRGARGLWMLPGAGRVVHSGCLRRTMDTCVCLAG